MNRLCILAAAAAVALAGCAAPRPNAETATTIPAQWYAPLPHAGTQADLRRWWLQFDDPLLVDLIDAAQQASPTIASAASRIGQARAARAAAGAALLPTLDATAAIARGDEPPAPLASYAQAGLRTAWEIDLFGRQRADADAAQARLEGAQAQWHEARVSVAAETANSYLALRTCERQLDVTRNDARSRAETARLLQLSAEAGFTPPADAALARASAAEGAARATQQAGLCEVELKALVALTALPEPDVRQRLATPWHESMAFAMSGVPAIPAHLLAQRADVYRAQREVAAASAEVGSARADRFPALMLNGSVAAGRVRTGGVTADLQTWSIGPLALTLPLFDGGRRAANVEAAEARYQEAAALYAASVRQAVREVEEALVNLESARARSEDVRVALEGFRTSFEATQARYRSGLASLIELEDQRRALLGAETAVVALQRERVGAWIALYRAVGGGWTAPDTQAPESAAAAENKNNKEPS